MRPTMVLHRNSAQVKMRSKRTRNMRVGHSYIHYAVDSRLGEYLPASLAPIVHRIQVCFKMHLNYTPSKDAEKNRLAYFSTCTEIAMTETIQMQTQLPMCRT